MIEILIDANYLRTLAERTQHSGSAIVNVHHSVYHYVKNNSVPITISVILTHFSDWFI